MRLLVLISYPLIRLRSNLITSTPLMGVTWDKLEAFMMLNYKVPNVPA